MSHAYPSDLTMLVEQELGGLDHAALGGVKLGPRTIAKLISTAYQASLLREEERPVTFRVVLVEPEALLESAGPPSGLHRLHFEEPRQYDAHELRRLTPAAKLHRALVGVRVRDDGELEIWGVAHSGPAWLRAMQGGRGAEQATLPFVSLTVSGPGRILVRHCERVLGRLANGRVRGASREVFDSVWLPAAFRGVRGELLDLHAEARARDGADWPPLDPDFSRRLGQHFIRRMIATIRLAGHGGTLLIVPPSCAQDLVASRAINVKYLLGTGEPRRRFRSLLVELMNTLCATSSHAGSTSGASQPVGWAEYEASTHPRVVALDEAIFELAHLVAGFADVDGAVVLTQRFEILGFGAEISGELPDVGQVARALDIEGQQRVFERADGMGTRHRSMYRLCHAFPEALGVVVSQDGGVRVIRHKEDAVTYWDQISIGEL